MKLKISNLINTANFAILLGIVIPTTLCLFLFSSDSKSTTLFKDAVYVSNEKMPPVKLEDVISGMEMSEQVTKDKNAIIIVLLPNCGACNKDIEIISNHFAELSNRIKFYGILFEDREKAARYLREKKIPFPVLLDKDHLLMKKFHIRYYPTKFLIRDGIIKKTTFGNFRDVNDIYEWVKFKE